MEIVKTIPFSVNAPHAEYPYGVRYSNGRVEIFDGRTGSISFSGKIQLENSLKEHDKLGGELDGMVVICDLYRGIVLSQKDFEIIKEKGHLLFE